MLNQEAKSARWPSAQDYNEAVQNLHLNACDEEMREAIVCLDAFGIPRPISGAFATVYRLSCADHDIALRCFLRRVVDQERRYSLISESLSQVSGSEIVPFRFLKKGILVTGVWFPALKMDWAEGESLDQFIHNNLEHPDKLERLAGNFLTMIENLRENDIAHGDLQHNNILVVANEELRLVDYDGMFVPSMEGMVSNELGHRNFQHPLRNKQHFGAHIDNFSSWVIYASLIALRIDPNLWCQLGGGDDCLLFRRADFLSPEDSRAFSAFENHPDQRLRKLGNFLRAQLEHHPSVVPFLQLPMQVIEQQIEIAEAREQALEAASRNRQDLSNSSATDIGPELLQPTPRRIELNPLVESPKSELTKLNTIILIPAILASTIWPMLSAYHPDPYTTTQYPNVMAILLWLIYALWGSQLLLNISYHKALAQEGEPVLALVADLSETIYRAKGSRPADYDCSVTLLYTTYDGVNREDKFKIPKNQYCWLVRGTHITVLSAPPQSSSTILWLAQFMLNTPPVIYQFCFYRCIELLPHQDR